MARNPVLSPETCYIIVTGEDGSEIETPIRSHEISANALALGAALELAVIAVQWDERPLGNALSTIETVRQICAQAPKSAIMFGHYLEGAITQVTLQLLMEGLDVFVCLDGVETAEPEHAHWFLTRLRSYGADIVSFRQMLLELAGSARDDNHRRILMALLDDATVKGRRR